MGSRLSNDFPRRDRAHDLSVPSDGTAPAGPAPGIAGRQLADLLGDEIDLELQRVEARRRQLFAIGALASVTGAGIAAFTLVVDAVDVPAWVGWAVLATTLVFLIDAAAQERTLRGLTRGAVAQQVRSRELEQAVTDLGALHEIAQRVNGVLLPEEVYDVVLAGAVELLGATHGTIRLRVGARLAVAAAVGPGTPNVGSTSLVEDSPNITVLTLGVADRDEAPPRLAVPVTVGRRHVGVLEVTRPLDGEPFTDRLSLLAQLFAEEAATAFVNANRYDLVRSRTEQLMAATEDRTDAVADTVHDLRAPLAGLSGFAQLLRDRFERLGEDGQREAIAAINEQVDVLAGLIDTVFESASAEAHAVRTRQSVDLVATVRSAVTTIEHGAIAAGRMCSIQLADGPAIVIESDPDALRRIVTNLIDNAVEHGGQQVVIRLQQRAREVRIHVADRGDGIPADQLDDLFRRQLRPDGSPRGRGLPIVEALVRALGGRVAVRSQVGVGSVFTVRLPRSTDERP